MSDQGSNFSTKIVDDESSDIELPTVNVNTVRHDRLRRAVSSRRQTPVGLLDKLTKDVTSVYREMVSSGAATSMERADLNLTQQLERMEDMADEMLEKLAEHCQLLETLRGTTSVTLNQNLPRTYEAIQELHEIYRNINRIEEVVHTAEGLTDGLENAVVRAENELIPPTTFKSILRTISPFHLPKAIESPELMHLDYYPAPVLSVSEIFPPHQIPSDNADQADQPASKTDQDQ